MSVAIVGGFAAGKTTIADELCRRGYTRVSLAHRLKEVAGAVFNEGWPVSKNEYYRVTAEDGTTRRISGRQVLQELGQSVKVLDRDFWLKWLLSDIEDGLYGDGPYVCDDCRFPYEASILRDAGFSIVRVETPDTVRFARYEQLYGRAPTPEELSHPSETQVDLIEVDMVVSGMGDPVIAADSIDGFPAALLG